MSDYTSSIKAIVAPRTRVYTRLSDLSGLASVQDRLPEEAREKITIAPIDLTLWIQLLEPSYGDTRLRLTLRADLNFFMRKMIGSKLNDGIEKLAEMLTMIPYND